MWVYFYTIYNQGLVGNTEGKRKLGRPGVDGKIMLK
jgi:hypothetical protein